MLTTTQPRFLASSYRAWLDDEVVSTPSASFLGVLGGPSSPARPLVVPFFEFFDRPGLEGRIIRRV